MRYAFKLFLAFLLTLCFILFLISCGEEEAVQQQNSPAPQKHTHTIVTDAAIPATCESSGLTEGSHCSGCNAVITEQAEVPKLEHTPVTDEAVMPTCNTAGLSEGAHCEACKAVITPQQEIPKLDHTPTVIQGTAPTCEASGVSEGSYCSVCGETIKEAAALAPLGHNPVKDEGAPPSCLLGGTSDGESCSVCGKVLLEKAELQPLGHDITNGQCSRCDYWFSHLLEYTFLEETSSYTVSGTGTCTDTDIVIPSHYQGFPVTKIGYGAFSNCKDVASVKIPSTVTYIDISCFLGAEGIESIEFEEPYGWVYCTNDNQWETAADLSSPEKNAYLLTKYSLNYYWKKA